VRIPALQGYVVIRLFPARPSRPIGRGGDFTIGARPKAVGF
jgi:hypothetical protein